MAYQWVVMKVAHLVERLVDKLVDQKVVLKDATMASYLVERMAVLLVLRLAG